MSATPENPFNVKQDPQRASDWNDGFVDGQYEAAAWKHELEKANARIAELEAQVRERDEALKIAWEALTYYADKRYFSERYTDGDLQCTADNALAHPQIAGAK